MPFAPNYEKQTATLSGEMAILRAQVQACHEQIAVLATTVDKVHSWLVCACVASNDDMAQSFPEMEAACREALEVTHCPISDQMN